MIWLIGAGSMAMDYAKVLKTLDVKTIVIGRGEGSAKKFSKNCGFKIITGGLNTWLKTKPTIPDAVIVAVNVEHLATIATELIEYGIKNILLEKPGGITTEEIKKLNKKANQSNAEVYIAYNRRFYASTLHAKKMIETDGGVTSFNFEFTEWAHVIETLDQPNVVLNNWFLANSSHVIDLAFFLGGKPKEISTFTSGSLKWHPKAAVFAGAGISENSALFSYHANWGAPGRWGVEILTNKNRYYFRPMEELHIQKLGSVKIEKFKINDLLDQKFKPGLYLQTKAFLKDNKENPINFNLHSLKNHLFSLEFYNSISGY
jgi:predicted dehydrogenase